MSKSIEIKVSGCEGCPFWREAEYSMPECYCNHPYKYYDGNKEDEFIEHCPLKQMDTVIKFERRQA
jgi:hypothetical protein